MANSMSATEMGAFIDQENTQGLFTALTMHFLEPKTEFPELYQNALYYAAERKENEALALTKLLMVKVFTSQNPNTISTILTALDKALKCENRDFIVMVLDRLKAETGLLQALLIHATPELLTGLLKIQPELLAINEKDLFSLLDNAFKNDNIELITIILQKQPELLAQLILNTDLSLNVTVYAQIADKAPKAIELLFEKALEKKNFELVAVLLEQNIALVQEFSEKTTAMMIELLKEAIDQGKINFVVALLDKHPELLYKKAKATGKKPAVWAAKQKQWPILDVILSRYSGQHENGDFHIALLWALKEGCVDIILNSNLDLICTSAETLDYDQNILHYAMAINHSALIKKILTLQDKELLQALMVNRGGLPQQTPLEYAVHAQKWAAVWCYFQAHTIKKEQKEDITKLNTILIKAVKHPCDEAQRTALFILDAADKIKYLYNSGWIIDIINAHFLNKELTELQKEVFSRLLRVVMDKPQKLFEDGLNVNETLFIRNLVNIKEKIAPDLFKQLVLARKNRATAIEYAAEQSRWEDVRLLAQQYNPENSDECDEYKACGYFNALEDAIKKTTDIAMIAALALLNAAAKIKYSFDSNWIKRMINVYFLNKELTELQKEVFSRLLSIFMNEPQKLFEDGLNVNEKLFIRNLVNIKEKIEPALFKQLILARKEGKTAITYAVQQSRWEDIRLLAEQYTPENFAECTACGYFNALDNAIMRGTTDRELTAALALIKAIDDADIVYSYERLIPNINCLIFNKPVTDEKRNTTLSRLLDLGSDETIVRLISNIVCRSEKIGTSRQAISPELQERGKQGDKIKENVLVFIEQINVPQIKLRIIMALLFNQKSSIWQKDSDSLSNGTRLALINKSLESLSEQARWTLSKRRVISFLRYILSSQNNDVLKMALGIIERRHMKDIKDMTNVVLDIIEPIASMLANEPSIIQLNIFNRLLENCAAENRVAIIQKIAASQSKGKERIHPNMVRLIQAIDNSDVKIRIILDILTNENGEFPAEMISALITGFINDVKPSDLAKIKLEILNLIKTMGVFVSNLKPGEIKTELLILQDFLRIIVGEPSLLVAIEGVEPGKIQATIKGLYQVIIVGNVQEIFLKNLKICGTDSKSLVYEAIPTAVVKRSLSKANTANDTSSQKPPVIPPSAAQKATGMLSSFPLNPCNSLSGSSSSSSSFFPLSSAPPLSTPASGPSSLLAGAPLPSAPPLSALVSAPAFLASPGSPNQLPKQKDTAIAKLKSLPPPPNDKPQDEPSPMRQEKVDENNNLQPKALLN